MVRAVRSMFAGEGKPSGFPIHFIPFYGIEGSVISMENGQTYLVVYKDDKGTDRAKELEFIREDEHHFIFMNKKKDKQTGKLIQKEEGILKANVVRWQGV